MGTFATGQLVGPYEIVGKLGEGGMGVVYKARDQRLGRFVALKFLGDSQHDPVILKRFIREAQTASALNHPNIVTIYDICEVEQRTFIVMEFVDGKSLRHMISPAGMPVHKAIDLARQIADAAGAAHSAGIVHRDLKPGNIMVLPNGRVKVLDFGLAKFKPPARS